jgi:hypothetical protein
MPSKLADLEHMLMVFGEGERERELNTVLTIP